ncbi:RHS repeat-associated core domain-containing protein [Chondromyces crocatus]|uniref:Teneurin-like YD-shell domain-containing protein n=1 Tax=Chondromyces crocatus TaxID=52 RepID=A0A0K1EAP7_CHOCO|nr:RHS repeat-associated core domain-containing protein [Chondromyces crocatus]AKT37956.1 uncharacterized protein CMC5_020970 [Chondromyces crocatus]
MHESIHSNAFNFSSYISGGVDPRTGQYTASIHLAQLRPPNLDELSRDLTLGFSALSPTNRGFGVGWSLNLTTLDLDRGMNILTFSDGRSFRGNALPQAGQDLTFRDQKLKDFRVRVIDANTFDVIHKDGLVERLVARPGDPVARLAFLRFPSGETFQFHHEQMVDGVPYLTRVVLVQTGQSHLTITYQAGNAVLVEFPVDHGRTARILLRYQNNLLTTVTLPYDAADPVGDVSALPSYAFSYMNLGPSFRGIERLRSPAGSVDTVQYLQDGLRLNGGGFVPCVMSHAVLPGRGQPTITKTYQFSQDRNFLGYESGSPVFVEGEDNLYLVRGDYSYESTENVLDGTAVLSSTVRTFNKFHLLTREAKVQQGTRTTTTITYNDKPSLAFEQQPANLQQPRRIVTRYEHVQSPASGRDEIVETETDDYGNTLSTVDATGVRTSYDYFPAAGTAGQCPADPFGFVRYVKRITSTPAPSASGDATARTTDYSYAQTSTLGGLPAPYFVTKATERLSSGQTRTFAYNDTPASANTHGLLRESSVSLGGSTTVIFFAYAVQGGATTTTTTTTGFDGVRASTSVTFSRITSRRWRETDVNGVTTASTYDALGRLVEQVMSPETANEVRRRYEYRYPAAGEANGWPMLVETDTQGVGTRVHYDGLGRVCSVEAQDDDRDLPTGSAAYQGTFRQTLENSYDVLGQVIAEKRHDWWWNAQQTSRLATPTSQVTRFAYDGWGSLNRTTFADGRVLLSGHDPVTRTMRRGLEGEGMTVTTFDAFDNPSTVTLVHADGRVAATTRHQYDGFGRKVAEEDPLGNMTRYSYDAFDREVGRVLPDGTRVQSQYAAFSASALSTGVSVDGTSFGSRTYDGLSRVTSESVGGRTTRYGYGERGDKPSQIITPSVTLQLQYAAHLGGRLVSLDGGGDRITYQYSPRTAALAQGESGGATQDLRYFASGLMRSATDVIQGGAQQNAAASRYAYSMSGLLQTFTDGFGNPHTSAYDAHGRLEQCQNGTRVATYAYDRAGRVSMLRVEDTAMRSSLVTSMTYDDFGRETRRAIIATPAQPEQVIATTYVATGQIGRRVTTVGGELWRDEVFSYDSRRRLQRYQCDGSQPPRDASGRAVREQVFSFDRWSNITRLESSDGSGVETTNYTYGPRDPTQLTRIETHGKESILDYDEAGNLVRDERGQRLVYDGRGRLVQVLDADQRVLSQYHYDSMGRLAAQTLPDGVDAFRSFQGESIVGQTIGGRRLSFLTAEGNTLAQGDEQGGSSRSHLFATDGQNSTLTSLDAQQGQSEHFRYTAYGERSTSGPGEILLGFNGEFRDPVTGWYFLGNGYRVYNPTLMRFHSPDGWSPFGQGGVNPYVYCGNDPINRFDPTGHLSTSAWVNIGIGIASILFGVFTLGAGAAVGMGVIAGTGVIGALATTSALSVTAAVVGVASSAVGIAASALEDNQKASGILNWVATGLGIASGVVGITAAVRSAASTASAGAATARAVKNEVAGISESLLAETIPKFARADAIALGFSVAADGLGLASAGVGVAATVTANHGDTRTASILGWVSLGLGATSLATGFAGAGHSAHGALSAPSSASSSGSSGTSTASRSGGSAGGESPLRASRLLGERATFRLNSDRINNVYNNLPVPGPSGIFSVAEFDAQSIFITRL